MRQTKRATPLFVYAAVGGVLAVVFGAGGIYLFNAKSARGALAHVAPESATRAAVKEFLHNKMPADDWHVVEWYPVKSRPKSVGGGTTIRFTCRGTTHEGGKELRDMVLELPETGESECRVFSDGWTGWGYWHYENIDKLAEHLAEARQAEEKRLAEADAEKKRAEASAARRKTQSDRQQSTRPKNKANRPRNFGGQDS